MIVRELDQLRETDRVVSGPTWVSHRLLLRGDGMGFSMHDTTLHAGTVTEMEYRNHVEAVYCVAGRATLEDLTDGRRYVIRPGTIYALDGHERHRLIVEEDLRVICVFNPALVGPETHDAEGVYPLL